MPAFWRYIRFMIAYGQPHILTITNENELFQY